MKSLLLDTNVLVLLVVGNLDDSKVGRHRRLRQFDIFDLERVTRVAESAAKHVSTPNILTEVSNHLNSGEQEIAIGAGRALMNYIEKLDEVYVPSQELVGEIPFAKFGLADAAVIEAASRTGATVLTSEWSLQGFLEQMGLNAINIFHLKQPRDFH